MSSVRVQILISLLCLALVTASPWLWQANPLWVAVLMPVVAVWSIWLVVVYLKWARGLGRNRQAAAHRQRGD